MRDKLIDPEKLHEERPDVIYWQAAFMMETATSYPDIANGLKMGEAFLAAGLITAEQMHSLRQTASRERAALDRMTHVMRLRRMGMMKAAGQLEGMASLTVDRCIVPNVLVVELGDREKWESGLLSYLANHCRAHRDNVNGMLVFTVYETDPESAFDYQQVMASARRPMPGGFLPPSDKQPDTNGAA